AAVEEVMAFTVVATLYLVIQALVMRRLISGSTVKGNVAQAIDASGHLIGSFLVVASVVDGSPTGESLGADAFWVVVFGLVGVALQAEIARLGTSFIVGAGLRKEIERGNAAAGVAAAGHNVATGVVVASCVYGHDLGTLAIALEFFAIAQVTLHI